ncbi:transcriptional activator RinB [Staphylococcus nepalensis]|uniref:transcriptional activator RinB n=1 Tax=Staphylococcus nepalensis TaxID=214473 RepID=UPI003EE7FE21
MKHILKPLLIICLYELSKAITYEIIVRKQANDMVDVPRDYEEVARIQGKKATLKAYSLGGYL